MRVIWIALMLLFFYSHAYAQQAGKRELTSAELACLQKLVYFNECSGKPDRLIIWSEDEDFPSLGIGHFIWYPPNQPEPYRETFPQLLVFLKEKGVAVPAWINSGLPWTSREDFLKDLENPRMAELRVFLLKTGDFQTQFIVQRIEQLLPKMLDSVPKEKKIAIAEKFYAVEDTPNGMFALIDYVNFKGEGTALTERLEGVGWGLLQVLEEMNLPEDRTKALEEFVDAAERVLERRVKSTFAKKDETKRLKGWKNRVRHYLDITC